jgi:hypothetical protein
MLAHSQTATAAMLAFSFDAVVEIFWDKKGTGLHENCDQRSWRESFVQYKYLVPKSAQVVGGHILEDQSVHTTGHAY